MSHPNAPRRSVGSLALVLFGSIAIALGLCFTYASIDSAFAEGWGGHASGLSLLVYGLMLTIPGALALWQGFRTYFVFSKER